MGKRATSTCALAALLTCSILTPFSTASELLVRGQTLYVPVYSHIYGGDSEKPFYLAATVSIRNTDPKRAIEIRSAEYYSASGSLVRTYLDRPLVLGPLSATRFVVPESDVTGGSGASFLVRWQSDQPANPPLVESVMIGTRGQQGLSFTSRAQVLEEQP